jgi:hypothetical protein
MKRRDFLSSGASIAVVLTCTTAFNIPFAKRQPTNLYSIDVSESAPRDISSLLEWSSNVGIQYDLTLTSSTDADSSKEDVLAIATRDLQAGECVLYVPNEVMLTTNSMQQFDNSAANLHPSELPAFSLFLQLLEQYQLDTESPYYGYLNSLPRYYTNGASMTDFCFGCLPPYAAGLALEDKSRCKKFVNALDSVSSLNYEVKSYKDLIRWAYNALYTRYQEMPDGNICLIPLVDYLNHGGVNSNAYVTYDEVGNAYVYTACEIPAGDAITLCYDDPTNPSALLARYGFLDESSDATYCKYIITNPSYQVYDLGYPNSMLFYKDGSISQEVWDVILYQELGKVSRPDQESFYQACMNGNEEIKQGYCSQYWDQILFELQDHVNSLINELEELEIGLLTQSEMGQDSERHPRLPLLKRHNEFVKNVFDSIEVALGNMMFSS